MPDSKPIVAIIAQGGMGAAVAARLTEHGARVVTSLEGRSAATLERVRPQIEQYEALCDELGHAPGDVALAWLLHQPAVTAPIIGPRTSEQLDSAERAVELVLDEPTLQRLNEIFPGHRTAPEDYAW